MAINFEHVRVYNFMGAIRGMRNSWESWDKIDSYETSYQLRSSIHDDMEDQGNVELFILGEADRTLALTLARAGSDHRKYLRQILVSVDIVAAEYWWKEYATYKVGTVENSTSMMHKMGSRLVDERDFDFEDPYGTLANRLLNTVNEAIKAWWTVGKKKPSTEWRELIQATPQAFIYRRTCTLNYEVLRNIYQSQRKTHRLQEWRDFCSWIATLPHAELIMTK